MEDLERFLVENKKGAEDKHFLVIDVDRWAPAMLSDIARQCVQKKYTLCVSNPNFEVWLLLHIKDIGNLTDNELTDIQSKNIDLVKLISRNIGGYNKSKLKFDKFSSGIDLAITQAEACDISTERWPNNFGSRVYLAVKPIIASKA